MRCLRRCARRQGRRLLRHHAASPERVALRSVSIAGDEITGGGFGSAVTIPPATGSTAMKCVVDAKARGTRIGRRLYEERRKLAERTRTDRHRLFGGRMPELSPARRAASAIGDREPAGLYLDKVRWQAKIHDPGASASSLPTGSSRIGVLEATICAKIRSPVWAMPFAYGLAQPLCGSRRSHASIRLPRGVESVRIATCQLQARAVSGL